MAVKNLGTSRIHNKAFTERGHANVVMWDVMRIDPNQVIKVVCEGGTSPWRQGVWLKTDRGLLVNDQFAPSMELWVDTAPPEVVAHCMVEDGNLSVYNIWDSGRGRRRESQASREIRRERRST